MVVPEPGHFLAPGARITSRVGNTSVFVDVAEIATALDYQRPTRPVNFPRPDETFDQNEIAGYLYEHRRNARIPHWPGRFTTAYRFINQVICFNLYPRGREGAPQRSVGNLMYAFMGEDTVSDWALYIFGQMCDFRDAPTTLRMPFPCLVTKILRTRNVPGKRFYSNDDLLPGDLDSSFIHRTSVSYHTRPQESFNRGEFYLTPTLTNQFSQWFLKPSMVQLKPSIKEIKGHPGFLKNFPRKLTEPAQAIYFRKENPSFSLQTLEDIMEIVEGARTPSVPSLIGGFGWGGEEDEGKEEEERQKKPRKKPTKMNMIRELRRYMQVESFISLDRIEFSTSTWLNMFRGCVKSTHLFRIWA
ncbi:hypothetical protein RHGRI_033990 [Rhododendron griersonianum]|uniref:Uncharacterized protein n=1 Tax=Rhododendron griersonianum TaxID=479676 RepID=A0AAV6I4N2_9ERIC|nr:hypothetical protein RHGRI_033990 [Rhododendron griersonianum]